tara:strand:- start:567 stop:1658 length:1092 start_codon:yes stop_codon:yes gene_type:complete
MESVLMNALAYVDRATVLVHVSQGYGNSTALKLRDSKGSHGRLIVNPKSIKINKNSPGVLRAHLSNFLLCDSDGMPCSGNNSIRFVIMPANAVLFRPGLAQWVLAHSMSFCTDLSCSDLKEHDYSSCRGCFKGWPAVVDQMAWTQSPPSALYSRTQERGLRGDDTECIRSAPASIHLQRMIHAGDTGNRFWRSGPVGTYHHEGSFYPVHVLRAFIRCALPASRFEHAMRVGTISGCIDMFKEASSTQAINYSGYMGSCQFDENLLPTFVWQHYSHLIPKSSPPVVVLLWISVGNSLKTNQSAGLVKSHVADFGEHLLAHPEKYGHVFGLKAPLHEFPHSALMIPTFLPHFRVDAAPNQNRERT